MTHIVSVSPERLGSILVKRSGEVRLGEKILFPETSEWPGLGKKGCRFALFGVPEDIGVRANFGRPGAEGAWSVFLDAFLNLQENRFLSGESIACLGHIEVSDLLSEGAHLSRELLRPICGRLDQRVEETVSNIHLAGLLPILVGGGHNNSFPLLSGTKSGLGLSTVQCINFDAHADYRAAEGRHSGNGFTYAQKSGALDRYFVFGLQESSALQENIERFSSAGFRYSPYESVFVRNENSLQEAFENAANYFDSEFPLALEIDLDAVAEFPSSSCSPVGFSLSEAAKFVDFFARKFRISYLHLTEGAPSLGGPSGGRIVGRGLSLLVSTFMKACVSR